MKKIKDLKVVVQPTSEHFHDELMWCIKHLEKQGLEVTINNPHVVRFGIDQDHYVAVVEGRK